MIVEVSTNDPRAGITRRRGASPRWRMGGFIVDQRDLREGKPRQKNPGPPSMGVG